jgi:DNA-binding transcriptional LysR family regulator
VEDAERAASDLQAAPRGLLRVTSSVAFGAHQLVPAIADYLVAYPDVSVDLILKHNFVDLVEERIDLAIRQGQLSDSSLIARKLYAVEMVLCASPDYLAANGTPQQPRDLVKHNCLIYTYAASGTWTFTDPNGKGEVVRISGRILADSGDALLTFALKDTGIVLAPDYLVADALRAGRLTRLLPKYKTPATPVYAVYPHSNFLSAKTKTFIDFLAARFAHLPQMKRDGGSDGGAAPDLREVA